MRRTGLRRGRVTLGVVEVGDPERPAAVIAHGAGSTASFVLRCFAASVDAAGMRLVAYDLRGHASSTALRDVSSLSLAEHAADFAAVAERADGIVYGGISLGARIAIECATTQRPAPDGLLLALPAWLGPDDPSAAVTRATAHELRRLGTLGALARIDGDPAVPDWIATELRAAWSQHDGASLIATLDAASAAPAPDAASLARLQVPAGVVGAPDDHAHPLSAAKRYAAALPRSALWRTSLAAVGLDRSKLGASAVGAWRAATRQVSEPR
ncbi:MAG: alpha/beta fold hydrolase [Mycobacteriales bacterium]|nr:alpha/beta hydrolase [Frankia sp.]